MASTSKCEYCGGTVSSEERICPHCGAENPNYVVDTPRQVFLPKTIEELKEYCAERGMPLLRMRFFIGENYKQPKAFGIYRDGDRFIVYKNKADGSRAIRYQGPDEAYAVNELFQKLLVECHNRGIYPDGKPDATTKTVSPPQKTLSKKKVIIVQVSLILSIVFIALLFSVCSHRNDGYYRFDNQTTWYRYGGKWYYSELGSNYWHEGDVPVSNYTDYALGDDYDSDWGVSNFKDSTTWDSIHESHSSGSSDYDSWDSGGTDWDSDW